MSKLLLFFSSQKCLRNIFLNLIGAQSLRYILSKLLYKLKSLITANKEFLSFKKNGYGKIENFLNTKNFSKIETEFHQAINDLSFAKETHQINGEYSDGIKYITLDIDEKISDKYPNLFKLKDHEFIKKYFYKNEQKEKVKIFCRLERIIVKDTNLNDPNKEYHYDTFHNTFKAWLFISEVRDKDGPFLFMPKTHLFSITRLVQEWYLSIMFSLNKANASFRLGNDKIAKRKNDEKALKFNVKKNTFVMANTHALHRRGDAEIGAVRDSIQFWSRENPFKIFI